MPLLLQLIFNESGFNLIVNLFRSSSTDINQDDLINSSHREFV